MKKMKIVPKHAAELDEYDVHGEHPIVVEVIMTFLMLCEWHAFQLGNGSI
jgi:hypothetical protein